MSNAGGSRRRRSGQRQSIPISETKRRRAQDDRLADDVRADITRRVGGRYLPRVLSQPTLIEAIVVLEDDAEPLVRQLAIDEGHRDLRYWLAEFVDDLDYDPAGEPRDYSFRKRELQAIDYELDDAGLEPDAEINRENPPLAPFDP